MNIFKDNLFLLDSEPVKKARNVWYNSVLDAAENGVPEILAIPEKLREMLVDHSWGDGFLTAVEWIYGTMLDPKGKPKKEKMIDEITEAFKAERTPWVRLETLVELANRVPTPMLEELMTRIRKDLNGGAPCPPQ